MPEITILERSQLTGKDALDIFNKIGITSKVTDFAILTGAAFSGPNVGYNIDKIKNRCGYYWTKTKALNGAYTVDFEGDIDYENVRINNNCIRPVLENVSKLRYEHGFKFYEKEYTYFYFGEYPDNVVDNLINQWLEEVYKNSLELIPTGKCYTLDYGKASTKLNKIDEYVYRGKKYVRVKANSCYFRENFTLSNGIEYKNDDYVWVEVQSIKWIYDKKSDLAVSEKLLLSGIIFSKFDYDGDFEDTVIRRYIDNYMTDEIIPSITTYEKEDVMEDTKDSVNPYDFDFSDVSEEEIIKGCVEANIAVMLHGRSGDGKSARVKELDPDAEILYLINASPDSLGGKSIVYNGEMIDIPPTWYTRLVSKCESEPDKIHIVFFDEITNAPPSIQGMAFNIILDKEVNGKWKLPDNARIVAAGNELEESRSAYGISEPLFNRFAHVYIETKVEDWLRWASTPSETYERLPYKQENIPMKIHPSIYAFITYKGECVLRTQYNGIKPNADPRKWGLASKVLYETNKPEMIRSLVGEEVTREFISFCKEKVITIEDVISGNYSDSDLRIDTSKKYNTAVHLSKVDLEHLEIVRNFIKQLGPETCALFDTLWSNGNIERLEKIKEIKIIEKIGGNLK